MDISKLNKLKIPTPKKNSAVASSQRVGIGKLVTPKQHIFLFESGDWEQFVVEWGVFQTQKYKLVTQLGGANDWGIDVACFHTDLGFSGDWDNFQCKYYASPLTPGIAIPELGKTLWHIFQKRITAPTNYYFFAPKDCGPSLKKLLLNSNNLKERLISDWDKSCKDSITNTKELKEVILEGDFLQFVEGFDFKIFKYKPVDDVIEEHRATPHFAVRFGGGLKDRPSPKSAPIKPQTNESQYLKQLHLAYANHKKIPIDSFCLVDHMRLKEHFDRQRESFYCAESLRAFARDAVPPGTFSSLQDEMYDGVIDTVTDDHSDDYKKIKDVLKTSQTVPIDSNGLFNVIKVKDRFGICHQLVNKGKFKWGGEDE